MTVDNYAGADGSNSDHPGNDPERIGCDQPYVQIEKKNNTIELIYTFSGFTDTSSPSDAGQREVDIPGSGFFSESEKPLLPSFGRFVQLPPDCHEISWSFQKGEPLERGPFQIKPAREEAKDGREWFIDNFNKSYGNKDNFYPENIVTFGNENNFYPENIVTLGQTTQYLDGYRVACVHVRPVQFNPKQNILRFFQEIKVLIDMNTKDSPLKGQDPQKEFDSRLFMDREKNQEGFGNLLLNPKRSEFTSAVQQEAFKDVSHPTPDQPEYLIIHGSELEGSVKKLEGWKKEIGLDVKIVAVSSIVNIKDEEDRKIEKIKTYIREMRKTPYSPLRYILLFGSVDEIPPSCLSVRGASTITTDHYYYTHKDPENDEPLLPWVSGGRIPVDNDGDGMHIVEKIIDYEKYPPKDPDYYRRITLAACFQDVSEDGKADRAYIKTMERIRKHMEAASINKNVNRVYTSKNRRGNYRRYCDGTAVPTGVRSRIIDNQDDANKALMAHINQGQLIIGHRGHGLKGGWNNPPLKIHHLKKLSPKRPSIFFSINCLTGNFDKKSLCSSKKSFAEEILKTKGLCPSLIASTKRSGSWRNDSMIKALFDSIWPGILPTFPKETESLPIKNKRIGDILNYAKAYILVAHGLNRGTKKHLETYHVIGDPTLQIWSAAPAPRGLQVPKEKQ